MLIDVLSAIELRRGTAPIGSGDDPSGPSITVVTPWRDVVGGGRRQHDAAARVGVDVDEAGADHAPWTSITRAAGSIDRRRDLRDRVAADRDVSG